MHVGTHGSCVRPNKHILKPSILLERTHEPCGPTYLYWAYCAARRVIVGSDVVHLENLLHGMRQESGEGRHVFRGKFVTLHVVYRGNIAYAYR